MVMQKFIQLLGLHYVGQRIEEVLGLKTMKDLNKISLAKSAWRFLVQERCLWIRVLKAKYGDIRAVDVGKSFWSGSHSWRSLVEGCKFPRNGLEWDIGVESLSNS